MLVVETGNPAYHILFWLEWWHSAVAPTWHIVSCRKRGVQQPRVFLLSQEPAHSVIYKQSFMVIFILQGIRDRLKPRNCYCIKHLILTCFYKQNMIKFWFTLMLPGADISKITFFVFTKRHTNMPGLKHVKKVGQLRFSFARRDGHLCYNATNIRTPSLYKD